MATANCVEVVELELSEDDSQDSVMEIQPDVSLLETETNASEQDVKPAITEMLVPMLDEKFQDEKVAVFTHKIDPDVHSSELAGNTNFEANVESSAATVKENVSEENVMSLQDMKLISVKEEVVDWNFVEEDNLLRDIKRESTSSNSYESPESVDLDLVKEEESEMITIKEEMVDLNFDEDVSVLEEQDLEKELTSSDSDDSSSDSDESSKSGDSNSVTENEENDSEVIEISEDSDSPNQEETMTASVNANRQRNKAYRYSELLKNIGKKNSLLNAAERSQTCPICNASFKRKTTFKKHIERHKGHKCKECGRIFSFRSQLSKHMLVHLQKGFSTISNLDHHLATNTADYFKCDDCGITFTLKCNLRRHFTRCHNRKFKCSICSKECMSRKAMVLHQRTHKGKHGYKCEECGKIIPNFKAFEVHLRIHTGERPYKCTMCPANFISSDSLRYHIGLHTRDFLLECSICGMVFTQFCNLRAHAVIHSPHSFKCYRCEKYFREIRLLKKHFLRHTQEKQHFCEICGNNFAYATELRHHLIKCLPVRVREKVALMSEPGIRQVGEHSKRKKFKCTVCYVQFSDANTLKEHLECHLEEFSTNPSEKFVKAVDVEAKDGWYKCSDCERKFSSPTELKLHIIEHMRPYSCSICGLRFIRSWNLKKHERSHKSHTCLECDEIFETHDDLESHKLTH